MEARGTQRSADWSVVGHAHAGAQPATVAECARHLGLGLRVGHWDPTAPALKRAGLEPGSAAAATTLGCPSALAAAKSLLGGSGAVATRLLLPRPRTFLLPDPEECRVLAVASRQIRGEHATRQAAAGITGIYP
eukprot:498974-Prymnesium_polylepis.2